MAENAGKLHVKMLTPMKVIYDDNAELVVLRSVNGDIGFMAGHEPLTTIVGYGQMRIIRDSEEQVYSLLGGFAEISNNMLTILTDAAEKPDEIDYERAKAARERAMREIREAGEGVDTRRAELALRRALVRMEVSTYPIIRGRHGDS